MKLTARVTDSTAGITCTPVGAVAFLDSTVSLGSGTLTPLSSITAKATFSLSSLPAGVHTIVASYQGDGGNPSNFVTSAATGQGADNPASNHDHGGDSIGDFGERGPAGDLHSDVDKRGYGFAGAGGDGLSDLPGRHGYAGDGGRDWGVNRR